MSVVRIEQRAAHLAGNVRLQFIHGTEGRTAKGTVTAISNTRIGSGQDRKDVPTAIQWTLWGKLAESAAQYLAKGSHVNIVGHLANNNYKDRDGQDVYGFNFVVEEIDYLDTKEQAEARRAAAQPA